MTYPQHYTLPSELLEQIASEGLEALPEMIRVLLNVAMQAERQQYLGVGPYERSPERRDQANGYKAKTITTRVGDITVEVPQVRSGEFYPQALEKGLRSERALSLALAEMYVQGVSTRKVAAITEKLCGKAISSSQVSQASAQLDAVLAKWRDRPLGVCPYLYLDARYEQVRVAGLVRDVAVLIAVGVTEAGKRQILGVSVSLSEAEVHWRTFLQSLVARGLGGVQLIISDAHSGLQAARQAVLGAIPWQRCQFHLQQNAQAYVPRQELKTELAADLRAIFNAANRTEADALLTKTVKKYLSSAPALATWLEANLPQGLTVFSFPTAHQRLIRTTNGLERLNREIKRRTRVVSIFPNEAACLRLVSALLMETSDEWESSRTYLTFASS
ncbi:MAG TPA: IS256 family transposase [Candidatus Nanoperiomorbaceae bacterium]|nr:IS256 family transposase [Candidatus Nanoperiomorbaceae bacterium]